MLIPIIVHCRVEGDGGADIRAIKGVHRRACLYTVVDNVGYNAYKVKIRKANITAHQKILVARCSVIFLVQGWAVERHGIRGGSWAEDSIVAEDGGCRACGCCGCCGRSCGR
jgi:hypothetical protein